MPKMRGQPPKTDIERLQSKLWFTAVSMQSGMNASQLERFFLKRADPTNGSAKELSHSWLKYANGKRLPRDAKNNTPSIVALAEDAFPGTAQWIRSPLWVLLKRPEMSAGQLIALIAKAHPSIRNLFAYDEDPSAPIKALTIHFDGWWQLVQIASFEAFGVMLAYRRLRGGYDDDINSMLIEDCRRWLHNAHQHFPAIRKHRDELVHVLHKFAPELGSLSYLGKENPYCGLFAEM